MKKIKFLIILFISLSGFISCQTIVDLHDNNNPINSPNVYYKDIGDKLNPYSGTWLYDDGVSYIKIVLIKKIKVTVWNHYEDYLIGAFQYKKNGVDIINTLNTLNDNLSDPRNYLIWGNHFKHTPTPFDAYTTDETRIKVSMTENTCISHIEIRTLILNGQPAIQIFKKKPMELNQLCTPIIPGGFYYLMKQ